jgi:UDP-N-acetylmuramate--alanine ligase
LQQEFFTAFYEANTLILLDIYAAAETPIPGVSSRLLYEGIKEHGHRDVHYLSERAEVVPFLRDCVRKGDILLTLGAGDIWKVAQEFCTHDT